MQSLIEKILSLAPHQFYPRFATGEREHVQ
jgi:hypothetical protein